MMSDISWCQKARMRAIEVLAFWRGRVNSRDLVETFGVSRVVALGDIHKYMEKAPGNLDYRSRDKAFIATSRFQHKLTAGVINEWMDLDLGICEYVEKPQFEINLEIARPLILAIHKDVGVTVTYRSMKHPNGTKRSLFPHTLVYSGFRWHVRAWCCVRKEFRDFNLSRISHVDASSETKPSEAKSDRDEQWHKLVNIQLMANPRMIKQERSLIEAEFGMKRNRLNINTRAALVMYTLQAYQVDLEQNGDIYKQRLILANPDEVAPFLWSTSDNQPR